MGRPMRAVVYGCKSSPDEKESVADQHRIVREAIGDDERIIGVFGEDNQSGYRKERGPRLEAAMQAAIRAAAEDGEAELWVFHSSRLARGDGTKGKRSIAKLVHDLLYEDVIVRSVSDPEMVTPMLAGIASKVSHQYSADLSAHTKRGMRQRKEAGRPMGPLAYGYAVQALTDAQGKPLIRGKSVVTERVPDPIEAPLLERTFERWASGETSGSLARWLNGLGQRTRRRKPFRAESVRVMIRNAEIYTGHHGYPRIISDELARRALDALNRNDPAAEQRAKGGRRTNDEAYVLRGLAFCTCGAPLYCTRKYLGGKRAYVCRTKLLCLRTCDRPPIPADHAEGHVLRHLQWFTGPVEEWIAEQVAERDSEHRARQSALDAERARLAGLDAQREQRMSEIIEHGITSPVAFELIERIDQERESRRRDLEDAEAQLAEHKPTPDVDAALDYYNSLRDVIAGRIASAKSAHDLNAALHDVLGGMWMALEDPQWANPEPGEKVLRAEFALRKPDGSLATPFAQRDIEGTGGRLRLDAQLPSGFLPELTTRPRPNR